jgi:hypothetical protein
MSPCFAKPNKRHSRGGRATTSYPFAVMALKVGAEGLSNAVCPNLRITFGAVAVVFFRGTP